MKVNETLDRDPRQRALANSGQARITGTRDDRSVQELRAELENFVCEGQYADAIVRILRCFLDQLDRPRQNAAWVSGFFGSGKSHLLKVFAHLWVDMPFQDGATARSLVPSFPDEIRALFRELDVRVARSKVPALAAGGTLPSGRADLVRLTVLSIILRACGLPEQYPQAQFCLWLREQGHLEQFRSAVERSGKDWFRELHNLYASGLIARAVLGCDPRFARDETEARQVLRQRFPNPGTDITTAEFLAVAREALGSGGDLPLTILVLDEVQQFIGDSTDRAVTVTELAEAVQIQLDSRVMLVASGQSALSATPHLQKLRDRFRITVQLSDADVETVTRRVLLSKKPSGVAAIQTVLDRNSGEISKHLRGSRLAERPEDRRTIVEDYPLLPVRRRFWEECLRAVDKGGTHSQLRSQLRILHDALQGTCDSDLGALIPSDVLYDAISPDLVNSGVLLNEISLRIHALDDGTDRGRLRKRASGLVFLISKLPREAAVDLGVRATAGMVADLLVDDLEKDSGPLRKSVAEELEALAQAGTLMKVGDEYRLQTTEGAEWERALKERVGILRGQEAEIEIKREQILAAAAQRILAEIRLQHGDSKLRRTLSLHARPDAPPAEGEQVSVWMRDGWSSAQKEVDNEARRRGHEDPVIHLFFPKKASGDLQTRIIEAEAARQVLDAKGAPVGAEGVEARDSMNSRLASAENARDEILQEILGAARVLQGGGNEVFGETLRQKFETAAAASLDRLFPRFREGDHRAWELVLKRAREGSDQPLVPVGWDRAAEEHPIVRQVLAEVGNGARGGEVRKALKAAPFGWPQDAIDAALATLLRTGTLRATLNGQPIGAAHLDQSKIQSTEFRPEKVRLGTSEKVALRGLYQKAGVTVKSGEEETKATVFLDAMLALAAGAGGDAPLPARPDTRRIDDLKRLAGSEQLGAILAVRTELESSVDRWNELGRRRDQRLPGWNLLEDLLARAETLPIAAELEPEVEAIRKARSLLEDPDRVAPLRTTLANALRKELTAHAETLRVAHDAGLRNLESDAAWKGLAAEAREALLSRAGLAAPVTPTIKTDDDLLRELTRQSLDARSAAAAAVPARVVQVLEAAARKHQPTARRIPIRMATLETASHVRDWIAEHEKRLMDAVADGPVIVG